ncbi:S-layer homology domain-containing protein [Priestia endophytica]|uniref:S-layer homology domain-containing protein n=1 Tax=Priestia endophytica TaxID=135735 RepID=UPI002E251AED|nr:S-layer homology domain-containing protein [Priestia endophytica]
MAYQPKSYRKFLVGTVSAAVVASAIVPAASAASFSDVTKETVKDHYQNIATASEKGYIKGYGDGTFKPYNTITRGQVVKILARTLGDDVDTSKTENFSDVPSNYSDKELVEASLKVRAAGVFTGNGGKLLPDQNITRQQMAKVLVNGLGLEALVDSDDTSKVKDLEKAYSEYREDIQTLSKLGVTDVETFNPETNLTRAQFASFIVRAYEVKESRTAKPSVQDVTAVNGKVTVEFNKVPETAPTANDFTITKSVNGGTATSVAPTDFKYDASSKTATFSVEKVEAATVKQTVSYSVAYKETDTKSGSFTVDALPAASILSVGAAGNQATVIFNSPVDAATAQNVINYTYDNDRNSTTNVPVHPTEAKVNTEAVGPYAAGQVVTLTFNDSALSIENKGSLNIQNVKSDKGIVIASKTVNVTPVADGAKSEASATLTNGAQTSTKVSANAGTTVKLNVKAKDDASNIVAARYRIQNPDNTFTSWTNLEAEDGAFDETSETAVGSINTTGFAGGDYKVYVQTVDASGKVSDSEVAATLEITKKDITAPVTVNSEATYKPATRTVEVKGSVTDADSDVKNVQYRVSTYNASTNAYTTSTEWTNATATDGSFNEKQEDYKFATPQLNASTTYLIEVRSEDAAGNTSKAQNVTVSGVEVAGGNAKEGTFKTPANSGDTAIPGESTPKSNVGEVTNKKDVKITGVANDNIEVASIEYAVYRDADKDGSYETQVQAYGKTGVTINDGSINSDSEDYTINYDLPSVDGKYRILVRTTDTSGNERVENVDTVLDTVSPTVTIAADTETSDKNDFIVTFSEGVQAGTEEAANEVASKFALDKDNYTVNQGGQVVQNAAASVTKVSEKQFKVTFAQAPTDAQTISITSVQDLADNAIKATSVNVPK